MLVRIILILSLTLVTSSLKYLKNEIKIGGLFHNPNDDNELAFRAAIHTFNVIHKDIELDPVIEYIPHGSSFKTEKALCKIISKGVAGVFGPFTKQTIGITESVCNTYGIPHFIAQWKPESAEIIKLTRKMTVNMYPDSNLLAKAVSEIIVDNDWRKYFIFYETPEGLMRMKDVLQIHNPSDRPIIVRELDKSGDYRPLLKRFQSGVTNMLIDCGLESMINFLNQAHELEMLREYNRYILAPLDSHIINFDNLKDDDTNITTLRLGDSNDFVYMNAINEINQYRRRNHPQTNNTHAQNNFRLDVILIYDAVKLFGNVLSEMNSIEPINIPNIDCGSSENQWERGAELMSKIKLTNRTGITGSILIDEDGSRKHFDLEIIELTKNGFRQIGKWNPSDGIKYMDQPGENMERILQKFTHRDIRVVSKYGEPFLMDRPENGTKLEGNDRYEGFVMDLVNEISLILNFTYQIEVVPDGMYGNFDKVKQEWNGIVKHIMEMKADMGVADLTVTYERKTAVDFSLPFMTLGISILYSQSAPEPPDFFSFLSPFALDVWLYMATAYLLVSLLLFGLARMVVDEWESTIPYNKSDAEEELKSIWNIQNSTWTTVGFTMGQGSDLLPKGISTRLICASYWTFALIMLSSYTANMAAFLTLEKIDKSIESVDDLAQQVNIKYGALRGGSTAAFFQHSNNSLYKKMWTVMEQATPSVFPKTNAEGIDRVAKSKKMYAFFVESSILDYNIERNCNLTRIGHNLDSKGYGIALPFNSPFRKLLNSAILKLQENGKLESLRKKWWKELRGGGQCNTDTKKHDETSELGIAHVGGVFLILLAGCTVGLLIGVLEFLWNVKEIAIEENMSLKDAFRRELKFVLHISQRTKPVYKKICHSDEF